MALYKVVSNYYTDILDTIRKACNDKFQGVIELTDPQVYTAINEKIDKLYLIRKLSSTAVKLENLHKSQVEYWKTQSKTYALYILILMSILIIALIVLIYTTITEIQEIYQIQKFDQLINTSKVITRTLIILAIIYTLYSMLSINLKWARLRAIAQKNKIDEEFLDFEKILFRGNNGSVLTPFLTYVGYTQLNNELESSRIKNNVQNKIKENNTNNPTINEYINFMQAITTITHDSELAKLTQTNIMTDIIENLTTFYNKGKGYYDLKLKVVSSSNVLTFREINRIMNYYYFLTLKKSTDQDLELSQTNIQNLITEIIIDPINKYGITNLMASQPDYLKMINKIASDIMPYNIDLSKYSQFINNALSSKLTGTVTAEQTAFITNLFKLLNKEIYIKKQASLGNIIPNNIKNAGRFYSENEFIDNLDGMVYLDLSEGMNIQYLEDIMVNFDKRINDAEGKYSLDDLNYEDNKFQAIYSRFILLFMIIVGLIFVYFLISWIHDFNVMLAGNAERSKYKQEKKTDLETKRVKAIDDLKTAERTNNEAAKKAAMKTIEQTTSEIKKLVEDSTNSHYYVNLFIRLLVPAGLFLFVISIVYSKYIRTGDINRYNQEIASSNTSEFLASIKDLNKLFKDEINPAINNKLTHIKDLTVITDPQKFKFFDLAKNMIDKFEKCNYVREASKTKFPFPYAEVSIDVFMLIIIIIGVVYITGSFAPGATFNDIIALKKIRNQVNDGVLEFKEGGTLEEQLIKHEQEHGDNIQVIIISIKVIFFAIIIMFLVYYSMKVLTSSSDFQAGIYSSSYYDNSETYP
jgi:hypothetical protein